MNNGTTIIEEIIQSYPDLKKKRLDLKYAVSGSNDDAPTASAAMAELPPEEQRRYDAILTAIRHTAHAYPDGARRLLVIQASYWGSSTDNVLLKTISWLDAQEYRMDFVQAVVQRLGLNDCSDCIYWRQLFGSRGIDAHACHYCYDTGMIRKHDERRCYSKCLEMKPNVEVSA